MAGDCIAEAQRLVNSVEGVPVLSSSDLELSLPFAADSCTAALVPLLHFSGLIPESLSVFIITLSCPGQ